MLEVLKEIATICSEVSAIACVLALLIKPVREKVFGLGAVKEGQKCLLRSEMLKIYYEHKDEESIRQHTRENMDFLYTAYKALGGNSFIDDIYNEVREWEIRT